MSVLWAGGWGGGGGLALPYWSYGICVHRAVTSAANRIRLTQRLLNVSLVSANTRNAAMLPNPCIVRRPLLAPVLPCLCARLSAYGQGQQSRLSNVDLTCKCTQAFRPIPPVTETLAAQVSVFAEDLSSGSDSTLHMEAQSRPSCST